jgi:hypothetical protein
MMKLFKKFLIPFLAIGFLAGCGEEEIVDWTPQQVLAEASNFGAILINGSTGTAYADRSQTVNVGTGDYLIGSRVINVKNVIKDLVPVTVTVNVAFEMDDETLSNWTIGRQRPTTDHDRFIPTIPSGEGAEDYSSVLTATLSYGEETLAVSWNIRVRKIEIIETTIGAMRNGTAGVKVKDVVKIRGYITAHFDEGTGTADTHMYAGVYIADGERAIMLYAGVMSSLWWESEEPAFAIGDLVEVVGSYEPYNGLAEVKPASMVIIESDPNVLAPVNLVISDAATQWSKSALTGHDSRITVFNNLTYVSGTVSANGQHSSIYFKSGTTEVLMYINYHVGTAAQDQFRTFVAGLTANVSVVNFTGVLSWYNGPQLSPTSFADVSLVS